MEAIKLDEQIHSALRSLTDIHHDIPQINSGGCGWFVYFVKSEFEKRGIDTSKLEVIYLDSYFSDEEEIEYNLSNKTGERTANHLLIKYDGVYYDGEYFGDEPEDYWSGKGEFSVNVSTKDLHSSLVECGWNPSYKIEKYNDMLHDKIVKAFDKITVHATS